MIELEQDCESRKDDNLLAIVNRGFYGSIFLQCLRSDDVILIHNRKMEFSQLNLCNTNAAPYPDDIKTILTHISKCGHLKQESSLITTTDNKIFIT